VVTPPLVGILRIHNLSSAWLAAQRRGMAPKPNAKPSAAPGGEPPSTKGGAGLGQGRKKATPALGAGQKDLHGNVLPAKTQVSLATLIGARTPAPSQITPDTPADTPSPSPAPASAPAPPSSAAPAFQSAQELGELWHSLIGYGDSETDEAEVEKVLKANSLVIRRVIATDESFFFGPAKELLLAVAKRLAAGPAGGASPRRSPQRPSAGGGSTAASSSSGTEGGSSSGSGTAEGSEDRGSKRKDFSDDAEIGGGIKAAAASSKKVRKKGPEGARGHIWQPRWLSERKWLRTVPDKSQDEWETTPDEVPDSIFCVCCVTYTSIGHKDVLTRKVREAIRSDKLAPHENAAHNRAMARYEERFGPLDSDEQEKGGKALSPAPVQFVEPPLASLLRTVITVALSKSAVRHVSTFVQLQRANGADILCMADNSAETGVHTLLHAAAVVLRREQDKRLRAAAMLSTMGDGSNDRRTTEQVEQRLLPLPCPRCFLTLIECVGLPIPCVCRTLAFRSHVCAGDYLRSLPNHQEADFRYPARAAAHCRVHGLARCGRQFLF